MAMITSSGIARSAPRKLKQLGEDVIALSTPQELYDRAVERLQDARAKLEAITKKQLATEKWISDEYGRRREGKVDPNILAEKAAATAEVHRLEGEAAVLYAPIAPKPLMS